VNLQSAFPLAIAIVCALIYSGLLSVLIVRRRWAEQEHRFALYLALVLLTMLSVIAALFGVVPDDSHTSLLKIQLYTQAIQPLFLYAFIRAFVRLEDKPWGLIVGLVFFVILALLDLTQVSLSLVSVGYVSNLAILRAIRTFIWAVFVVFVATFIAREFPRTTSPLHRNRLSYAVLAFPFFFLYDALDLLANDDARPFIFLLQVVGVLILAYATLRHELVDLRYIGRQVTRYIIVTTLAVLVYIFVFGAVLGLSRRADLASELVLVIGFAVALALFYQPLHSLVQREIETSLFGQRYNIQSVVQEFSQRLTAESDLDQLALEGRTLLRRTFGAIEAALLLVRRDPVGYTLRPIPQLPEWPAMIRLDAPCSMIDALTNNGTLLQYDVDRLPRYADISSEARIALQKLSSELYVPIRKQGIVVGVWTLGQKLSGDRYSASDLTLLATLADQSAVAIENARLVADLREQMRDIRSMRDYLNSTLSSIASGVVTLDHENNITSVNQAAEAMLGIQASAAIGMHYDRVLPALEGAQLPLLINRVLSQTAEHLIRDTVAQVPERGPVNLTLHISAMRDGDALIGIAIVLEDLTEQARLELERRIQEEEQKRVRGTFERYVAPTVVDRMLTDPRGIALGGERQLITVLFADLHGFTRLSERIPPEELVNVLNGYLSLAAQVVMKHEGTLDKFFGDGFMALFNAPLPQGDHPRRAAQTALALQREAQAYAARLPEELQLAFRVGLHTGEAVVGNIGTSSLMNYTAVGDTVNSAKRLEENAEAGQVLMSKAMYGLVEKDVVARSLGSLDVKGRSVPIEVFELIALRNGRGNAAP